MLNLFNLDFLVGSSQRGQPPLTNHVVSAITALHISSNVILCDGTPSSYVPSNDVVYG